jgi:osmotically-inducible protein OsmY
MRGVAALVVATALTCPAVARAEPCLKAAMQIAESVDRRATEEVARRIASDDTISPEARTVEVTTTDGVVTLRGVVSDDEDRAVLSSLAESSPGVRSVDDQLRVQR